MKTPAHQNVSCKYGAPMGRSESPLGSGKIHLAHVRLDSGGYDPGGDYWGHGQPLFVAWDTEGGEHYLRAASREAAKTTLREQNPGVSFYR